MNQHTKPAHLGIFDMLNISFQISKEDWKNIIFLIYAQKHGGKNNNHSILY
jgi:hypothetical protein